MFNVAFENNIAGPFRLVPHAKGFLDSFNDSLFSACNYRSANFRRRAKEQVQIAVVIIINDLILTL